MSITSGIQPNIFRAVSGSLFSSPINWSRGFVPAGSDVAIIADNCIINVNRTIGSLVVNAPFTASINTDLTLNISQSINVLGHLSCSGTPTINVLGPKNNINSLSPASSSFFYLGSTQTIPGVTYWTLSIRNPGLKKSNGTNTTVLNLLSVREGGTYDLANSSLIVSGTSRIGENAINGGTLLKTGIGGSVLFAGSVRFDNAVSIFSGNPRVEIRNGFTISNINNSVSFGNNDLYFTTNNQSIYEESNFFQFSTELFNKMFISGGITLTLDYITTNLRINKPINGLSANDKLINKGRLYFTSADSVNTMMTGGFDYSTFNNFIGYTGNYSRTMLPYSSSYRNLFITGTGVKTLPRDTSVSGSIFLGAGGTLDMGNFDLIVSGTATIGENAISPGFLQKSTPGNIIFIGRPYFFLGFIILTNNPTVEFRNGIDANYTPVTLNSNNIRFTTNNQSLVSTTGLLTNVIISGSAFISGGINLNLANNTYYFDGPINGFSASDTLVNSGSIFFTSAAAFTGSLITGSSNFSFPGNTINFGGNYSGTSSTKFNTFFNLTISGTGIKTLGTSSYVSGSLRFLDNFIGGTLALSSSNFIVSGSTLLYQYSNLTKSGPGNILFNGPITISNNAPNTPNIDFSLGNPTIEVRNGMNGGGYTFLLNTGTGSLNFTTNNQTIDFVYCGDSPKFRAPITINGIELTIQGRLAGRAIYTFYNTIDGTNANSKLINNGWMRFTSASITNPMSTFGTFVHTGSIYSYIDYCFDGDFNIPYSNYFGLAIGGASGSKYLTKDLTVTQLLASSGSFATLNLGNYNFTNLGSTSVLVGGLFIRNPGSGSVLFSGSVDQYLNFSGSTGTTEFRNGLDNNSNPSFFTGTGNWIFSTNNQGLNITYSGARDFDCTITVSGSITLSIPAGGGGIATHNFRGPINGTVADSRFLMNTNSSMNYFNSATPMSTGILDATSSLGTTFIYASGSQNIRGGTYRNLTFLNGLKTLQGNVSVLGTFSTGSGATSGSYNLNGFTLTNP